MEIKIPKIVKKLEFKEYSEAFGETALEVWVNPPHDVLDKLNKALKRSEELEVPTEQVTPEQLTELNMRSREILSEQAEVYSELLSQGAEETRWSAGDVQKFAMETYDTDPVLWVWFKGQVAKMIREHRVGVKKA